MALSVFAFFFFSDLYLQLLALFPCLCVSQWSYLSLPSSCLVKFTLIWSQCNCLFSLFLSLLLLLLFFFLSLLLRLCSLNLIPESCRVLDFVLIDVHCLFCLCSFSFFFFFGFCGNSCFCWDCVIIWLISEFFLS